MTSTAHQEQKLNTELIAQMQELVMRDISAASGLACAYIGDRLGLYKAMAGSGPVNSEELARLTGVSERYLREWLMNQAAGGYVIYDESAGRYNLPAEHAEVLANEDSLYFSAGGLQCFMALMQAAPKIVECMRTGEGLSWGDHHPDLFEGTERFFRPSYEAQLIESWIPSVKGLAEKLETGAIVADVGCGHGITTVLMAKKFPRSRFYGFDNHEASITRATIAAGEAGVSNTVTFSVSPAQDIPDNQYDLIAFFDCLHDMGDPVGACKRAKEVLRKEGSLLIVEPMGGRVASENFNPVGRIFTGASVLCCTPNALAAGGTALGTVATDDSLRQVVIEAGFTTFARVLETPFNRIFTANL